MKYPLYCDQNLRLLPSDALVHLLGDDDLRWPNSFWINDEGKERPYFLINADMYGYIIAQVKRWRKGVKTGKYKRSDLAKSLARYAKIKNAVSTALSVKERNEAIRNSRGNPPPPTAPPRVPSMPTGEEAQSRVYFALKTPAAKTPAAKHGHSRPFRYIMSEVPSIAIAQLPPEISLLPQFKKFLKRERIAEHVSIMAFDSYFNQNLGRDLKSSVEFIEEMIRRKYTIPQQVLDEHKIRKYYLDLYIKGFRDKTMPLHHQPVMNGFTTKKSRTVQRLLFTKGKRK